MTYFENGQLNDLMIEFNSTEELFTAIGEYAVIITKEYSHNRLVLKSQQLEDGSYNIDNSPDSDNQNQLFNDDFDAQVKQTIKGMLENLDDLNDDNIDVDPERYTIFHPLSGQIITYNTKKKAVYESAKICLWTYQFFCQGSLYYKIEIQEDNSVKITDINDVDVTDLIEVTVNNLVRTYKIKRPPLPVDYSVDEPATP